MKHILFIILFTITTNFTYSKNLVINNTETIQKNSATEYVYIRVQGKAFSKKLKVDVDFGDSEAQQKKGDEYSEILTNKKSYAAILNYMAENNYELLQTIEITSSYQGSGGTTGVIFIMKKD